jgi:tyrosine-specific transport protein
MSTDILQERSVSLRKVISGTSLIAGTTIGAGMLGIPLVTAEAGFLPAVCASVGVWAFMLLTGLLYAEVALSLPTGANIFTMAGRYLGVPGRIAAGGMFLFLYYCLLVAYISGGAPLMGSLLQSAFGIKLDPVLCLTLFGVIFGGILWLGVKAIDRVNLILSIAMFTAFALLISNGSTEVAMTKLSQGSFSKLWFALPVLFSAFGYHNVVPSLCTYLNRDRKSLRLSLFLGTALALIVYLIWQWLILGSLSQEVINETLASGKPVTFALQSLTGKSSLFTIGQVFGFFALATSFLGVAFSVVDFLNDGLKWKGNKRLLLVLLTFLPPGLCAALNPALFETALGIAGGFGEAFLNGLLPVVLAWKYRSLFKSGPKEPLANNGVLVALFGCGLFVMGLEVFLLLK